MLTLKFTVETTDEEIIFIPSIIADYSAIKKKNTIVFCLAWVNVGFCMAIKWTRKK